MFRLPVCFLPSGVLRYRSAPMPVWDPPRCFCLSLPPPRLKESQLTNQPTQPHACVRRASLLSSLPHPPDCKVPMGWSVSTGGKGEDDRGSDAALVVAALRERYKVLTSRRVKLTSSGRYLARRLPSRTQLLCPSRPFASCLDLDQTF